MSKIEKKPRVFKTDSGEELPICPVSEVDLTPFIERLQDFTKPPVEEVDGVLLTNESDPNYLKNLDTKNLEKGTFFMAVLIQLGLDFELDEEQQRSVNRAKRKLEIIRPGAQENQFDMFVYAKSICPSVEELSRLMAAIQNLNNPTAQQVQNALDTFRPDPSRPAGYGDKDAPKWNSFPDRLPEVDPVQGSDLGGYRDTPVLRETIHRVAG